MLLHEERELVREYGIIMLEKNLTSGTSGNISVFSKKDGYYAMSPSSMDYRQIKTEDVVVIDLEGNIVDGKRRPSIEHVMHRRYYADRDDIGAVVHTHSPYASAASCLGKPLPAIHFMQFMCGSEQLQCAPFAPPGTQALADVTFDAMKGLNAVLMQNHGLIAAGTDIAHAMLIAEEMEVMCQLHFLARGMGGEPIILTQAMMQGNDIG